MNLDALLSLVSGAIWRAERLEDMGLETAASAWEEVSRFEEELAKLTPAKEPEGRIARRGAVRAALKANNHQRAQSLVERYLSERGTPKSLRADFQELMEAEAGLLAEQFPSAAKHHKPGELRSLMDQFLERGPFCLAAA